MKKAIQNVPANMVIAECRLYTNLNIQHIMFDEFCVYIGL